MSAFQGEVLPLDEKFKMHHDPVTGISQSIPMLDPKWIECEDVEFISYVPPAIKVDLLKQTTKLDDNEMLGWEERANFIHNDLKWLLCQSHSQFWNQVIFNKSLDVCLDSFFKLSPRSFDVWKFLPEKILNLQKQIHRSVFMVYLRMSTHKESKEDFFTPSVFGDILYENFLFDIPKIMDLCALYGGENSGNNSLLTKMLENVFNKQPKYIDDLHEMIPSIFQTFEIIEQEVGVSPNGFITQKGEKALRPDQIGFKITNVNDIVLYLFDTCQTLLSLLHAYSKLCEHFFKVGLVQRLAGFYEEVIPLLDQRYSGPEWKTARIFLRRCKIGLVKICALIMDVCCMEPLITGNKDVDKETKQDCIEVFLSVIMELLSLKGFLRVYHSYRNIEVDMDAIHRSGLSVDETRIQYIISAVSELNEESRLQSRLKPKENKSAEVVGAGVLQEPPTPNQIPSAITTNVNDVELNSMVSHVKDLLPDCGEGFIMMCLQQLDYDVEKTINLILEDSLPPQLQNVDRHLSKKDLLQPSTVLSTRHSVYDNDEFDIFSKEHVDLSRVHKGKSRFTDNVKTLLDDKKDIESVKDVLLNYDERFNDYEDEYDDTYDTQDVGAQDVDSADELSELTLGRAFTIPRVLRNLDNSGDEEKNSDSQESTTNSTRESAEPKESREKEVNTRRQDNQRYGSAGTSRVKRNYETGKNKERDRAHKDKNKARIANHNRKAAAAKKQARGMAF